MDKSVLKEQRIHGTAFFPLGTYTIEHEPGEKILDCHWHNEWEFLLVTEGKAIFQIDTAYYNVSANQAIFVKNGSIHAGYPATNAGCTYRAIVFHPRFLCENAIDPIQINFIDPFLKGYYCLPDYLSNTKSFEKSIITYIYKILELCDNKPHGYELNVKAHLLLILSEFIEKNAFQKKPSPFVSNEKSNQIKKILSFIHSHYQTKITIHALCQEVNMSESYFCRFFKQMLRMTPMEYIQTYRIKIAAQALKENHVKILEVAFNSGFSNLSYFNNVFKKYMNCTPSEYRTRNRVYPFKT